MLFMPGAWLSGLPMALMRRPCDGDLGASGLDCARGLAVGSCGRGIEA